MHAPETLPPLPRITEGVTLIAPVDLLLPSVQNVALNRFLLRIQLDGLQQDYHAVHSTTRTRILREAARLFCLRGYHGCSMRDIAKAVNLGAPAIYNHFKSKNELLVDTLDFLLSRFYRTVLGEVRATTPKGALFEILRNHAKFCIVERNDEKTADALLNIDFMSRELPIDDNMRLRGAMREYRRIIGELLDECCGDDDTLESDLRTYYVFKIIDRAGEAYEFSARSDPETVINQCISAVCRLVGLSHTLPGAPH